MRHIIIGLTVAVVAFIGGTLLGIGVWPRTVTEIDYQTQYRDRVPTEYQLCQDALQGGDRRGIARACYDTGVIEQPVYEQETRSHEELCAQYRDALRLARRTEENGWPNELGILEADQALQGEGC